MTPMETQAIKSLINQLDNLILATDRVLADTTTHIQARYTTCIYYSEEFNHMATVGERLFSVGKGFFSRINLNNS